MLTINTSDTDLVGLSTPDPLRFAFKRKKGAHAGGQMSVVAPNLAQGKLLETLSSPSVQSNASRCLYIHIPFCRVRCTYCNFFQYASSKKLMNQYFDALVQEIRWKASFDWTRSNPFQAVYIGGGTPTDLSAEHLETLGKLIRSSFPLTADCEITLEGRVNRFDNEKFESALEGGFNRFSFGVQSFDNTVRLAAKRLDKSDYVMDRLQSMVSYNAAPIVIDLLYGLPHQTLENWQHDLNSYLESGVDGVDLYQLIEMKGLPMERAVAQGKLPMPADTAMKASMFKMGVEFMAKHHQRRLSVNHWASGNRERSIYNSLAKTTAEVLPIGAGAGGNVGGFAMMQHRDMEQYIDAINSQSFPINGLMQVSQNAPLTSSIKSAFDRGVLSQTHLDHVAGYALFDALKPLFEAWQKNGLVETNSRYVTLTLAGQFWSVTLAQNVIQVIQQSLQEESLQDKSLQEKHAQPINTNAEVA
ncbi:heme anaerobic degradation radical SAM methyltransferase ChuW/HutW [Vibrio sp. 10N.261.55.A7]|uniref:heme anaerobic degradation radical SAM methyltransferase ChuW/HutW n=1 Tax=Vibrio sp. 10N.261.55.A7 TaxID=1880851 RepID=UPI000C836B37|nr:heme anaerobic degradation radical SAM methyltransferase ChuW/HutW [Vibrio sp. 10N.261.55.A7]PMK01180.1 putative heme utilization radical SAM enzyme HutW [Vibrio sp. 10N.261.55.A7]